MPRGNGGIIGPVNTSFSGVWSLTEAQLRRSANTWPNFYAALLSESATGTDVFSGSDPSDPYFEYTTLLLPGNGTNGAQNNTFLDGSTNNFTITRNGNTTQGTFSPFSQTGWGGAFNTSTTYLTVTDTANLRFGSSNFTIEAWVYRNASGATQTIASKGASTPTGWVFQISSADKLVFTDTSTSITGTTSIAANTWTYVAVVRAGTGSNQTTLYVNGTSDGTGTSATNFNQTSNMLVGADRSTTNFANGYISNLRLSNTNRTISSTPTTALTADANTIFLSLNLNRFQYTDSTAAYTNISVTGTPSVVAFSPFNPTASWSAATYGGSGYFDGSGDWLEVADNTALNLSGGVWTIEAWTYLTADYSNYRSIINKRQNGSSNAAYQLGTNITTGTLIFFNGTLFNTGVVLTRNTWNHVAAVYDGTNINIYLNGSRVLQSATGNTNYAANVRVGSFDSSEYWGGYITNVRILKGTAQYTGATYTVPTSPLTAITNTSLLLNFTNAGIYDATSKNDLETVGNAQISTAINNPFGSAIGNMYFDGTGDYLLLNQNNTLLNLGTAPFTIEFWFNTTSSTQYAQFIGNESGTNGFTIMINIASATAGTVAVYNGAAGQIHISTSSYRDGNWHYFALTRDSSGSKMFIDGSQIGSTNTGQASTSFDASSFRWAVASNLQYSGRDFAGYISNLRITKGYARTITASPTAAFPTL